MSGFLALTVGHKGCYDQVGAGTYTPAGDKKIVAIGIVADANVTNFKWDDSLGTEHTETGDGWQGVALAAAIGANAFIPLGREAKSIVVASGTVRCYFK